jgi:hypothetical protein
MTLFPYTTLFRSVRAIGQSPIQNKTKKSWSFVGKISRTLDIWEKAILEKLLAVSPVEGGGGINITYDSVGWLRCKISA